MTRRNQWRIVGVLWVFAALIWINTCTGPRVGVSILEIEPAIPGKVSGIDKNLVLVVEGPENVNHDDLYNWAAKQCRKHLVLPPVEAVPVIQRLTADAQTGRQKMRITCYRDKWSVPE